MSFYVICNPTATKDIYLKSKYEVSLVDFFFQRDCGYISVYFDQISLFRINIYENDTIDSINSILQHKASKYKQLTVQPSIKQIGNTIIFDSGSGKFKLSEEARQYFNIESFYISKRSFEWNKNNVYYICCDIICEQLVESKQFQILDTVHQNKLTISYPQYVDVQRTSFDNINISIFDEKYNIIKTIKSIFKLHFRPK